MERDDLGVIGQQGLILVGEDMAGALLLPAVGQVVGAQDHILGRDGDWAAVLGPQQVVGGEHQDAGSVWASADRGTWTAIWSPSKSALKAVHTRG